MSTTRSSQPTPIPFTRTPAPTFAEVELLTVAEAAACLGCGTSTLYRMLLAGTIPHVRIGRTGKRISKQALRRYIAEQEGQ